MPRGARWDALRRVAYARDRSADAPCWICGQPIDYLAPAQTPEAWEPDHYFPRSTHPWLTYDLGNLRPSHCHCNRARGDGGAGAARREAEGLGTPSRGWGA